MMPALIKCWTVARHVIRHHAHHHLRRVGHHIATHKAAAIAAPVIVCATVGGTWFYRAAPAPMTFSPPTAIAAPEFPLEIGPGFFGAGSPVASSTGLTPIEFIAPEFIPQIIAAPELITPPELAPSPFPGGPNSPTTPIPGTPIPEPASLALFSIGIAALYVIKRVRA